MKIAPVIVDASMFITGKMVEFITGNKESTVEKDNQKVIKGERLVHSEKNHKIHSQKDLYGNSGEKTNMH